LTENNPDFPTKTLYKIMKMLVIERLGLKPRCNAVVLLMGVLAVLTAAESPHQCEPEASGACHIYQSEMEQN